MYELDKQIGYKLRLVQQRHWDIFTRLLPAITPTQFSIMVRLRDEPCVSQNLLGRKIHMDAATTKGVIDRLVERGWLKSTPHTQDKRRRNISLTARGREYIDYAATAAAEVSKETLKPLNAAEQRQLLQLLDRLAVNHTKPLDKNPEGQQS